MEPDNSNFESGVREENNYLINRNILLRNYQLKLLEKAKSRNSIIYLPTGAGKTLIAIHVLLSRKEEITKPLSNGGKRAFFVVPTKLMTLQILKVLTTLTKFKSAAYNGDMNVDSWSKNKWILLLEEYHVSILTSDILKQILVLNCIELTQISLIVFDECHHATKNHSYKLILDMCMKLSISEAPLLLGLSSILIKNNILCTQSSQYIQEIENLFRGKIISVPEFEVKRFGRPNQKIILYKDVETNLFIDTVCKIYDRALEIFQNVSINSSPIQTLPEAGHLFKNANRMAKLHRAFTQAKGHLLDLGIYGGALSALLFVLLLEQYRLLSTDSEEIQFLIFGRTELHKIRHLLINEMGDDTSSSIIKFSSPRILKLLQILREVNEQYKGTFSAIIFVQQRSTTILLTYLLKQLSALNSYSFIRAEFIVGSSFVLKNSQMNEMKNEEIIKKFSSNTINVVVATSILEEGIDISACNVTINFDFPSTYPSYVQSKGRTRVNNSLSYVFIKEDEYSKKMTQLNNYNLLSDKIYRIVQSNNADDDDDDDDDDDYDDNLGKSDVEKMTILRHNKAIIVIDGITAIRIVDNYCSKLPQDKYSLLGALSWYKNICDKKVAYVQLPMNCPLTKVIEGNPRDNKKSAKRSAYLITVQQLVNLELLDNDLKPKALNIEEKDFKNLFPNYIKEDIDKNLPQPGTKRKKRLYKAKFAECLSECFPRAGVEVYLHVIDLKVAFDKPELQRKVIIYDLLQTPVTFALISSKKLRKVLQFPIFVDLGQINCDLLVNYDTIVLTESEIEDIKKFHFSIFQKAIRAKKNCQIFDNRNKEHSFFVAPVEKNALGRFVLNWDLIRSDFCRNNQSAVVRYNPTSNRSEKIIKDYNQENGWNSNNVSKSLVLHEDKKRKLIYEDIRNVKFTVNETDYKYFVIYPSYRNDDPPQCYVVNKICHDMTPLSKFPRDSVPHYFAYYKEKYSIEITNLAQPLLRVTALYNCSNFYKPLYRKSKREREKVKELEEHLVPELCGLIPFDRRFWLKSLLVPTVLNRIYHLYLVEEFRLKIIRETGLGVLDLPDGETWKPLTVKSCLNNTEEENPFPFENLTDLGTSLPLSELKNHTQTNKHFILDSERRLYEIGICDLEFSIKNLEAMETEDFLIKDMISDKVSEREPVPNLNLLNEKNGEFGPDLAELVEVFTSKSANDIINYERLEILGDSFLKFATTFYLFKNHPDNEGILTAVKGKLVGNRNLLYCGIKKNIQNVLNVYDFAPLFDWNPPLFCVPEKLVNGIISDNVDPAVLYLIEIPPEEQFSGVLSNNTLKKNETILQQHQKNCDNTMNLLLAHKSISDKTISDCVEALIGVYLLTLGLPSAFKILLWLGILPNPGGSYSELIARPYDVRLMNSESFNTVHSLLNETFHTELEELLDYRFNNKALLLEALSHPSYVKNKATHCYQRLEFLGDSVLDFLVTTYIYENYEDLTPGQVTDIRSSLVNNITFACLVVRYGIYKYLLSFSSNLNKDIRNFVSFQISRNHVVDDNVLILQEENDCLLAESVTVPKALGDLFESLAGAIFLDSKNSLETVWNVFYKLMKPELEAFTKTVPKTAIRLLFEICGETPYFEYKKIEDTMKATCSVYYLNEVRESHGFGQNKKEAKKSAAKAMLNNILTLKKSD